MFCLRTVGVTAAGDAFVVILLIQCIHWELYYTYDMLYTESFHWLFCLFIQLIFQLVNMLMMVNGDNIVWKSL